MTITLDLLPDTQRKLEALATRSGKDVIVFVNDLIEKTVQTIPEEDSFPEGMKFDEIAAPLRQDFKESVMSEDDFDTFIEGIREDIWQEQHKRHVIFPNKSSYGIILKTIPHEEHYDERYNSRQNNDAG